MRALAQVAPGGGPAPGFSHVFVSGSWPGRDAAVIAAVIDPGFLAGTGWDPVALVLSPPPGHRLIIRPVCQASGCLATVNSRSRTCVSCQRRLADHGLADEQFGLLPALQAPARGPGPCMVGGCGRERMSAPEGLCRSHADQRRNLGLDVTGFLAHPLARPLPACGPCAVAACTRQRRHVDGEYCDAHQHRVRLAAGEDPGLDEGRWRRTEPAIARGGEVSLRGLPPLVIAQVLVGLQQRCRINAVKTKEADLRAVCDDLRRQQAGSIADFAVDQARDLGYKGLAGCLITHARRALASPETEVLKDEWDLALFGHRGTVDFTKISQAWLRETAKRWAADDLPGRRIRAGRITSGGLAIRHHVGCLARLSETLRTRPDRGDQPAALDRAAMEAFLHRLAYLESGGKISGDARIRACREIRHVLARARAMGLTRPGAVAGGLGEDFAIHLADVPAKPEPGESGRDLPPEIMRQVCARLDDLTTSEMRTGIELAIDTGRRPEEIACLDYDCLTRDADGAPVLVYDNHKANRPRRRLPVSEATAAVITAQQRRVRARFPDTPARDLKLLPTDRRNPDGRKAITAFTFGFHHRAWVTRMPALITRDGTEFDKWRIFPYAYRHTYVICTAFSGRGTTKSRVRRVVPHKYPVLHEARARRPVPASFSLRCCF